MESEMELPLPPIQMSLDRLKSDGTFDQFRKMCLAAIEEEPSYRAQKEHVEILSRRYLNDNGTKEMTKNEVRSKLRLYVLDELKKPGVQASHTIEELVVKTLESKSPELFKSILDVVNTLLHPPTPPTTTTTTATTTANQPTQESVTTSVLAPSKIGPTRNSFELPIDLLTLPGLCNNIKREGENGTNKKHIKVSKIKESVTGSGEEKKKIIEGVKKIDIQNKDKLKKAKILKRATNVKGNKRVPMIKEDETKPITEKNEDNEVEKNKDQEKEEEKEKDEEKKKVGKEEKDEEKKKVGKEEKEKKEYPKEDEEHKEDKEKEDKIKDEYDTIRRKRKEEEDEEDVFDDNGTVIPTNSSSHGKSALRRSARIASHSSGDKSREGTPVDNHTNKRHVSSEEENKVYKKRKITDHVIKDSTSSDDEDPTPEEEKQKRGRRSVTKRIPTRRLSSVTSLSPPPSKSINKNSPPIVVTRSKRLVKRKSQYYPGEEQTESEDDEKTVEMKEESANREDIMKEEEKVNDEWSSKRRSKRIKK